MAGIVAAVTACSGLTAAAGTTTAAAVSPQAPARTISAAAAPAGQWLCGKFHFFC